MPKIKGGEFIVGKFEDTLPIFFSESRPIASVINFDADLYSSTICALNFSKSVMDKALSITDFEKFKAQIVEEYKSASKFITDAIGRLSEKNIGNVSSNLPTINSPPLILGTFPSLV